jgi:hypothetical protein
MIKIAENRRRHRQRSGAPKIDSARLRVLGQAGAREKKKSRASFEARPFVSDRV